MLPQRLGDDKNARERGRCPLTSKKTDTPATPLPCSSIVHRVHDSVAERGVRLVHRFRDRPPRIGGFVYS